MLQKTKTWLYELNLVLLVRVSLESLTKSKKSSVPPSLKSIDNGSPRVLFPTCSLTRCSFSTYSNLGGSLVLVSYSPRFSYNLTLKILQKSLISSPGLYLTLKPNPCRTGFPFPPRSGQIWSCAIPLLSGNL